MFLVFDCLQGEKYELRTSRVKELQRKYPGMDVDGELRKAAQHYVASRTHLFRSKIQPMLDGWLRDAWDKLPRSSKSTDTTENQLRKAYHAAMKSGNWEKLSHTVGRLAKLKDKPVCERIAEMLFNGELEVSECCVAINQKRLRALTNLREDGK